jgi:hypothetical protein
LHEEREDGAFIPSAGRVKPNHSARSFHLIPLAFLSGHLAASEDATFDRTLIRNQRANRQRECEDYFDDYRNIS